MSTQDELSADCIFLPNPCSHAVFQESLPFAVIGSNTFIVKEGNRVIGRQYPWGVVEGKLVIFRQY